MSKFNYRNIIIISILILFVLSISAVNAADIDVSNVVDADSSSKATVAHNKISEVSSVNVSSNDTNITKLSVENPDNITNSSINNDSSKNPLNFTPSNNSNNIDDDNEYKRTLIFVSDETLLEGYDSELTAILTDVDATPLVSKKVRIVIKGVRTVYGVTKEDGIATIPLASLKAGTYSCRAFFDGDDKYYSSYYDFTIKVLVNKDKKSGGYSSQYTTHYSGYSSNYYSYSSVQSNNNSVVEARDGIGLYKTGNPIALLIVSLMSLPVLGIRKTEKYNSDKFKYLAILAIALVCILSLSAVGASNLGDEDSINYSDVSSNVKTSSQNSPVISTGASSVSSENNVMSSQDSSSQNVLYAQNQSSDNVMYTNTSTNNTQNLSYNNTINNNSNYIIIAENSNLTNNHENAPSVNVGEVLNSNENINTINSVSVNVGSDSYDTSSQHISVSDIDNSFNSNEIINSYGAAITDGSDENITNVGAGKTWTVGSSGCDFTTLANALSSNQVTNGDTIIITPGTYNLHRVNVNKEVNIMQENSDLPVIFRCDEKAQDEQTSSSANGCILNVTANNVNITGITFENAYANAHGGAIRWGGANGTIDGCVFRNNELTWTWVRFLFINYNRTFYNGAAIYWTGADGTVKNSYFYNNTASGNGGDIYWTGANGKLEGNRFENSKAYHEQIIYSVTTQGGSVYWTGVNGAVDNCSFINEHCTNLGGAISWTGVNGTINNSYFDNNGIVDSSAGSTSGGSIYWNSTNGRINNVTIANSIIEKAATGETVSGTSISVMGANNVIDGLKVYNSSCLNKTQGFGTFYAPRGANNLVINNSLFDNCSSLLGGGIRIGSEGNTVTGVIINNTNFTNNEAIEQGAAMSVYAYDVVVENCICENNSAPQLGAVNVHTAGNKFINCTFINNSATSGDGGALALTHRTNGTHSGNDVINCTFIDNSAGRNGAAVFINGTLANVDNCTIINNIAQNGAGIYIYGANATVNNTHAINNTATNNGAGIYVAGDGALIDNADLTYNIAENGAGIYVTGDDVHIDNVFAENNTATGNGGAIYASGDSAVVTNATLNYNNATNGAGIYLESNNAIIDGYILRNNNASHEGAGIYVAGDNGKISDVTFSNNTAENGAGLYVIGSLTSINNVTLTENIATNGSGIYIKGTNTNITNSTITYNIATNGSGMYIDGSNLYVENSEISYNNASYNGGGAYIKGNYTTIVNSNFTANNAIPSDNSTTSGKIDGLGGAIYIEGYNTVINGSDFTLNTARNGSAIYLDGSAALNHDTFKDNQAFIYWMPSYNNGTHINSTLYGGNNILNAIYNNAGTSAITIDGKNPANSAEEYMKDPSKYTAYQDTREFNQTVVVEVWDSSGNIITNQTAVTDIYGYIVVPVDLGEDWYICRLTHLEDTYYKYITNTTAINVLAGLNVPNVVVYEGDITPYEMRAVLANQFGNIIPNAQYIDIYYIDSSGRLIPIIENATTDDNGLVIFNTTVFSTLTPGKYSIFAQYRNVTGNASACNTTANLTVIPTLFHIDKEISSSTVDGKWYPTDTITFTITVTNDNLGASGVLKNITVRELFDDDSLEYVTYSGDKWSRVSGAWIYEGSLNPGESVSFTVTFRILRQGTLTNTANVTVNNGLVNNTNISFNVTPRVNTNITVKDVNVTPGSNASVLITLKDSEGNPISGQVDIYVNGIYNSVLNVVNGNGTYTLTVPSSVANGTTYNITASFKQTREYNGDDDTGIVTVTLLPLVIVGDNITVHAGETVSYFNITVDNNFTGDVTVRFPDAWGLSSTTAHIVNGLGHVNFTVPSSALINHTYAVTITFPGSDMFLPSSGIGNITIKDKINTIISINDTGAFPGESVLVNVTLFDVDDNPLTANVTVVLPNGTKVTVEVVDGVGSFSFVVPVNAVAGTVYSFTGNYSGSLDYYGASGVGNVTVAPLVYHITKDVVVDVLYPGDNVTFTITVFNDNTNVSAILRNVTVKDLFNAGEFDFVSTSCDGWTFNEVDKVWTLNNVLYSGVSASFTVTFTVLKSGSLTNIANVTINEGLSSKVNSSVVNVTAKNDTVLVIYNVSSHNIPGSTVVWNVSLEDVAGNKISDNVTVTLPDGRNITVEVVGGVGQFSYTVPTDAVIGSSLAVVGTFNETRVYNGVSNRSSVVVDKFSVNVTGGYNITRAGQNATISITVVTDDPNSFNGDVVVRCDDLDLLPISVHVINGNGNITFTVPSSTPVNNTYNVSISFGATDEYVAASGFGNVTVIDKVVTVVTVSNATLYPGESVVMNVTLKDIDGNVLNGTVKVYRNGTFYCNVTIFDGVGHFIFTVPVNAGNGAVYNFAADYAGSLDYYAVNGSGNVTVAPLVYHIVKEISSDISSGLYPGDNVTFTITVFNDNTNVSAILRNVTVKDLFNVAEFGFVSTSYGDWTFNEVNRVWTLNNVLAPGDSANFTVTLTVLKEGNLINIANVTINEGLSSNSTSVTVPVIARNNTIITVSDAHGIPGSTVTLNVTLVDAAGNSITDNITVTLPNGTNVTVEVVNGVGNFNYIIPYDAVIGSSLNFVGTFNETRVYNGANDTAKVTVDKFNITITGVNVTVYPGENVNEFKITVITDDPNNPNRFTGDVTVRFNSTWSLPPKTVHIENGVGYINFTTPSYSPVDTTSIVNIIFAGSNDYLAAEGTGNVTFKKYVATIEVTNAIVMYEGDPSNYNISVKLTGIEGMPLDYSALHNVDIYVVNGSQYIKLGTVRLSLNGSTNIYIGNNILKGLSDGTYKLYANSSDFGTQWDVTYINNTVTIYDLEVNVTKVVMNDTNTTYYLGDEVDFNITVVNNGNATLHNIVVVDKNIEGLTYIGYTDSGWTYLGNNKWAYDGSLAPGEKAVLITKFNITKVAYLTNIANVTVNNGTEIYPNASINVTEQNSTIITVTNATDFPNNNVHMNVTLKDVNGNAINGTVEVYRNGTFYCNVPIINGVGYFDYNIPVDANNGTIYFFNISYAGAREYYSNKTNGTITVKKYATEIIINNNTDITGYVTEEGIVIPINLTTEDGIPFNGKVNVSYYGNTWEVDVVNGKVNVTINITADAIIGNKYPFKVTFGGNATYIESENNINVEVVKHTAQIIVGDITNMYVGDSTTKNWTIKLDPNHAAGSTNPYKVNVYVINSTNPEEATPDQYLYLGYIEVDMNGTQTFYENIENVLQTLDAGTYTIYANCSGDNNWTVYSGNNTINILPVEFNVTKTIVNESIPYYINDTIEFNITVYNNGNATLHNITVIDKDNTDLKLVPKEDYGSWIYVGDYAWIYNGSLAPGESASLYVNFTVGINAKGNKVNVTVNAKDGINSTEKLIGVLNKTVTYIVFENITGAFPGDEINSTIIIVDENGTVLNITGNVTVTVNGSSYNVSVENGTGYFIWTIPESTQDGHNFTVIIEYAGAREYYDSIGDGWITVIKYNTTIPTAEIALHPLSNGTVIIELLNVTDSALLNGTVIVELPESLGGNQPVTIVNGKGELNLTIPLTILGDNETGQYNCTIVYAGNNTYNATTGNLIINLSKYHSQLSIENITIYENESYPHNITISSINVTEGLPGTNQTIELYVDNGTDLIKFGTVYVYAGESVICTEECIFKNLVAGNYTLYANFTGSSNFTTLDEDKYYEIVDNAVGNLEVLPVNVTITKTIVEDPSDIVIYDNISFVITVVNNGNLTIKDLVVFENFPSGLRIIGNESLDGWTYNEDTKTWTLDELSAHTTSSFTVKFATNESGLKFNNVILTANNATATFMDGINFTVKPQNATHIIVDSIPRIFPNETAVINITLVDDEGKVIKVNETIEFNITVNGETLTKNLTLVNGKASWNWTIPSDYVNGTVYNLSASYAGDREYLPSNNTTAYVNVFQYGTSIDSTNVTAHLGEDFTFNINVDVSDLGPSFRGIVQVVDKDGNVIANVTINNGKGTFTYNIPFNGTNVPGVYNYTIKFDGNTTHMASNKTVSVEILPFVGEISVTELEIYEYDPSTHVINVSLSSVDGKYCEDNHTIVLYVNDSGTLKKFAEINLTMDSNGTVYDNTLFKTLEAGVYDIIAAYEEGDAQHIIHNATSKLIIHDVDVILNKTILNITGPFYPNDILSFNITVKNNGSIAINNAVIYENILAGFEIVKDSSYNGWTYNEATKSFTYGEIAAGEEVSFIVRLKVNTNGTFTNLVNLTINNESYNDSASEEFVVDPRKDSYIYIENITRFPGELADFKVVLVDDLNNTLIDVNGTVYVVRYDELGNVLDTLDVAIVEGVGYYNWTVSTSATNGTVRVVNVTFAGNREYNPSNSAANLTVKKYWTQIDVNQTVSATPGDNITINVTVTTENGTFNGNITVTTPNGPVVVEIIDGKGALVNYTVPDIVGPYTLTFNYPGNNTLIASSNTTGLTVYTFETHLSVTDVIMYEYDPYPQTINIIYSSGDSDPEANYTISLYVMDNDGNYIWLDNVSVKSGISYGFNELNVFKTLAAGNYTIFANYTGDSSHNATNATSKLTILPLPENIHVTKVLVNSSNGNISDLYINDTIDFNITVFNDGDAILHNVTIYDKSFEGLTFIAQESYGPWTYKGNGVWTYNGDLAPHTNATLTIKFRIDLDGTVVNNATLTVDGATDNETFNTTTSVEVNPRAKTTVIITNASDILPNSTVVMNITIIDDEGKLVDANGTVYIKELDQYVNVTEGKGSFNFTVPIDALRGDKYNFTGNYSGNRTFEPSTGSGWINATKYLSNITIFTPTDVYYGDEINITVNVTTEDGLFNGNITLTTPKRDYIVEIINGTGKLTYVVDGKGIIPESNLTATYAGNMTHNASVGTGSFNARPYNAEITINDIVMYEYDSTGKVIVIEFNNTNGSKSCGENHTIVVYVMNSFERINLTTVNLTANDTAIYIESEVFKTLSRGNYTLYAETDSDDFHVIINGTSNLEIIKHNITINKTLVNASSGNLSDIYVNDIIDFNITVFNDGTLPVTNVTVYDERFNGLEYISYEGADWTYNATTKSWTYNGVIENNTSVSFIVKFRVTNFTNVYNTANVVVGTIANVSVTTPVNVTERNRTKLVIDNITHVFPGEDVVINFTLTDVGGNLINKTIKVKVGENEYVNVTITNGKGTLTYTIPTTAQDKDIINISAIFNGDREYYPTNGTGHINVTKYHTILVVNATDGRPGENTTVTITLEGVEDGAKLNKTVYVTIFGNDYPVTLVNGTGVFNVTVPDNITSNATYTVNASYGGCNEYYGNLSSSEFFVDKYYAEIEVSHVVIYEGDPYGHEITINITGEEEYPELHKLYNVTVYVVNGTEYIKIANVSVAMNGTISFNESEVFKQLSVGNYTIVATATDDEDHLVIFNGTNTLEVLPVNVHVEKVLVNASSGNLSDIYIGDIVTFNITVFNDGNATIHRIVVLDDKHAGLTLITDEYPGWAYNGTAWIYDKYLDAYENASFLVRFNVTNYGNLTNNVTAFLNNNTNNVTNGTTILVTNQTAVIVNVTNSTLYPGDNVTVNITVEGVDGAKLNGTVDVKVTYDGEVVFNDTIDLTNGKSAFDFSVPLTATDNSTYAIEVFYPGNREYYNSTGKGKLDIIRHDVVIIPSNATTYPNGAVNLTLNVTVDGKLNFNGTILMDYGNGTTRNITVTNGKAVIDYVAPILPNTYNITYSFEENETYRGANASAHVDIVEFNISTNKTINATNIHVGDVVEFNITVVNNGNYTVDNVFVIDNNHTDLDLIIGSYGKWNYNNGIWTYNGTLAPHESISFVVKFNVTKDGNLSNVAIVGLNNGTENITTISNFTVVKYIPVIIVNDTTCYPGSNNTINFNVTCDDNVPFNGTVIVKFDDGTNITVNVTDGVGSFEYIASDVPNVYNLTYEFITNTTHYGATNASVVNIIPFNVSVNKTLINNKTIYVGDVVEFNITVTNDGNVTVDKVVVIDNNYIGLVLITGSYGKWIYDNGSWIYNGSLAAGESVTLTLSFKANKSGNYTNYAVVDLNNGSGNVSDSADYDIEKFSQVISVEDITCYPGSNRTIKFNVTSNGGKFNGTVYIKELDKNITVTDGVGEFEYIASVSSGIYNLTYIFDENDTHYAATNMSFVNVIPFNVTVNKTLVTEGIIYIGENVDFYITVTNEGNYTIDNFFIVDNNHTGLELVVDSYASIWTFDNETSTWYYKGSLAPNQTVRLLIKFKTTSAGNLNNTVFVGLNNNSDNISAIANVTVEKFSQVIGVEDITCYPGSNNTVRFNVTSNDNKTFNGAVIVKFDDGTNVTVDVVNGVGEFEYLAGVVDVYNVTYEFVENGTHYGAINASVVNVIPFNVSVNKTLIDNGTIYVGGVVSFNITVTNVGNVTVDRVVVFDDNHTGLVLITGSYGKWIYDNGSWIYNGSLAAGESVTLTLSFKANESGNYTNYAVVDLNNGSGNVSDSADYDVEKFSQVISVEDITCYPGSNRTIKFNVTSNDGKAFNGTVIVKFDDDTNVTVNVTDGKGSFEYLAGVEGIYNVTYEFVENGTHYAATNMSFVNVIPFNVTVNKTLNTKNTIYIGDGGVEFVINVTNNGAYAIDKVVVIDNYPEGLVLITKDTGDWTYNGSAWIYKGNLAAGASVTLVLVFNATKAGNWSNIAIADLNNGSDNVSDFTNFTIEKFTPTIIVRNVTSYPGANVTVPIEVIPNRGPAFTGNITVRFDDNSTKVVPITNGFGSFSYVIGDVDVYNLTYEFVEDDYYYGANNNSVWNVVPFNVTFDKKLVTTGTIYVGREVEFVITVTNDGNYTINKVVIGDKDNRGLNLSEASSYSGWTYNHDGTWTYNNPLDAGQSAELRLIFDVYEAGNLTNIALLNLNNGLGNYSANASFFIEKYTPVIIVDNITVYPGTNVTIPITVDGKDGKPFNGTVIVRFSDGYNETVHIVNGSGVVSHVVSDVDLNVSYETVEDGLHYSVNTTSLVNITPFNVTANKTLINASDVHSINDEIVFEIVVSNNGNYTLDKVVITEKDYKGLHLIINESEYINWTFDGVDTWYYNNKLNAGENTSLFLRFVILEAGILNNTAVVNLNNGSNNITVVSIVNVGKFHPNINIESIIAYPNDEVNVKINVSSEEGNYTGKLEITLPDGDVQEIDIVNGIGSIKWKVPLSSVNSTVFNIVGKIYETERYSSANATGGVNVIQDAIIISIGNATVYQGSEVNIPITVTDEDGCGITGDLVVLLPGASQFVSVVDGVGEVTWVAPGDFSGGEYLIVAKYITPGKFISKMEYGGVEVLEKTNIIISAENKSGRPGSNITIPIDVVDDEGNPFTGEVRVILPNGTYVLVEIINGKGSVSWNVPKNIGTGTYPIVIGFAGNNTTNPANFTAFVKINAKKATEITGNDVTVYNGSVAVIKFKLLDENGKPITGKVRVVLPDGSTKVVKVINGEGKVKWLVPANYKKGSYQVDILFAGNESLYGSTTIVWINVIVKDKPHPHPKPIHHKHYAEYKKGIQLYKTGNPITLLSVILLFLFLVPLRRKRDDEGEGNT